MAKRGPKIISELKDAIVCEDIRHEVNNKISLMGVFSEDIVVGSLPAVIRVAVFLRFVFPGRKSFRKFEVLFRFDGKDLVSAEAELPVDKTPTAIFASPQLNLTFLTDGELEILVKSGGEVLHTLKKRVITGLVITPGTVPPS